MAHRRTCLLIGLSLIALPVGSLAQQCPDSQVFRGVYSKEFAGKELPVSLRSAPSTVKAAFDLALTEFLRGNRCMPFILGNISHVIDDVTGVIKDKHRLDSLMRRASGDTIGSARRLDGASRLPETIGLRYRIEGVVTLRGRESGQGDLEVTVTTVDLFTRGPLPTNQESFEVALLEPARRLELEGKMRQLVKGIFARRAARHVEVSPTTLSLWQGENSRLLIVIRDVDSTMINESLDFRIDDTSKVRFDPRTGTVDATRRGRTVISFWKGFSDTTTVIVEVTAAAPRPDVAFWLGLPLGIGRIKERRPVILLWALGGVVGAVDALRKSEQVRTVSYETPFGRTYQQLDTARVRDNTPRGLMIVGGVAILSAVESYIDAKRRWGSRGSGERARLRVSPTFSLSGDAWKAGLRLRRK